MTKELSLSLRVSTKQGDSHEFAVRKMQGEEAISRLFSFDIEVRRPADETLPDEVVPGAKASLTFVEDGADVRVVNGVLETVTLELTGDGSGQLVYQLRLVPRAWRSTLVTTQQIFMDKTVPELIADKLGLVGVKGDGIRMSLTSEYPVRDFIVQYREDDVHLISRLAEHVGISFYFEHDEGRDTIVFCDSNEAFHSDKATETLELSSRLDEPDRVYALRRQQSSVPKVYVVCDYNYRTPNVELVSKAQIDAGRAGGIVEYGCHIKTPVEGEQLARVRAEEVDCHKEAYSGETSIPLLSAGLLTKIDGAALLDAPLLVTSVNHHAESAEGDGATVMYRNSFEALDSRLPFRPRRITPRPVIHGFVTGIVRGIDGAEDGQYAQIDDEGRYVVQFHFDGALGTLNTKASRPVRKAQPFAGAREGMHFPLKPGVEVALAFACGDPDRPVIIGALPNHLKRAVVTATNATVNRIETASGVVVQFGNT